MNPSFLKQGNYVSLIASIIILFGLIYLEIEGISYALSLTFIFIMWIVWFLALPSFAYYHLARLEKPKIMDYFAILAIMITLVGLIIVTFLREFLGIEIIVAGYTFEPIAGISIYLTANKINKIFSSLFFWGAVIFTAGLPLYLVNFGYMSIIGDVIKILGIIGLLSLSRKLKA